MKIITTFLISASLTLAPVFAIIGGQIVPLGSKAYTVGIRTTIDPKSPENFSYCAGALITTNYVLTTASCASEDKAKYVSVGAHYVNGAKDGEEITISSVTTHPNYNSETFENNFALLKLATASRHQPINLPNVDGSDIQSGMWATAMGWGITSNSRTAMASEKLRSVQQQVISNAACRKALDLSTLDMSQFCAGGEQGKSPCDGDSGDPIVKEKFKGDGDDVLIGLVSGSTCGVKGLPSIYARVSSVVPWIKAVIKKA